MIHNNLINKNHPFVPLYTRTSTVPHKEGEKQVSRHILSITGQTNPIIITLDDPFYQIDNMHVLNTRIERSEHTCEYYRNCPFMTLFEGFESLLTSSKKDQFMQQMGLKNTTVSTFISLLQNCLADFTSQSILYDRTFQYDFEISTMRTFWWDSPNIWSNYNSNWKNSNLWGSFDIGVAPFVLDSTNYTINDLVSTLNLIAYTYYTEMETRVPLITTSYDINSNRLNFTSETPFFLFPSNAYMVVGLRSDSIYASQFNYTTSLFTVVADNEPKLQGPDVLYIQNDESQSSLKNPSISVLSTVYLSETNRYPTVTEIVERPIHMQSSITNRLTFTLYSDIMRKILYQTNNKQWFLDVCITGRV